MGGYAGNLISFDDRCEDGAWVQAGTIADGPGYREIRRSASGKSPVGTTVPCFPEIDVKARGEKNQSVVLRPIVKSQLANCRVSSIKKACKLQHVKKSRVVCVKGTP